MKSLKTFLILIISLYIMSCDRLDGIDEGDRNTYTWKGRLVQDCNEEPAKNVDLRLEARSAGVPDDTYQVIAEGATDDDGYFTLTYRKIRKLSATDVSLILEDGSFSPDILLNAPVNQDVYRDIAIEDCSRIYVVFKNKMNTDSVYLNFGKFYGPGSADKLIVPIPEYDQNTNIQVIAALVNGKDYEELFFTSSFQGRKWNNQPSERHFGYGSSVREIKKSILSNLIDSIPSGFNQSTFNCRNFPYTDTVVIEF